MSPDHQRVRFTLAYDGTHFRGWAMQPGLRTVQGVFEQALQTICRQPLSLTVAGRTDAGVHARAQVAHADIPASFWEEWPAKTTALTRRLNSLLSHDYGTWMTEHGLDVPRGTSDVVISCTEAVGEDFDARFSALSRTYRYRVAEIVPGTPVAPLSRWDTWWVSASLDEASMQTAAQALLGEHDFLSFCKPREGATTVRTLQRLDVQRVGDHIEYVVSADAFCHSMVRSLVGALVQVGAGRRAVSWPAELLRLRSRQQAAPLAPPQGLTLEEVTYPPAAQWRARQQVSRARRETCCGGES